MECTVMAKTAVYHDEGRRLRAVAKDRLVRFAYTTHALAELRKDQLTKVDVEFVLKRAAIVGIGSSKGEETWNAQGRDTDERLVEIVIVLYEYEKKIKIVTAWHVKEARHE
jgi:hypothetical protein